jgi:hypothetical protein
MTLRFTFIWYLKVFIPFNTLDAESKYLERRNIEHLLAYSDTKIALDTSLHFSRFTGDSF